VSLTVTFAVPLVTIVTAPVVFQYPLGDDVISFGPAGAVPPVPAIPVVPAVPVVPPRPAVPVVPALPIVPPRPAVPDVPAAPPPAPVVPPAPPPVPVELISMQVLPFTHVCVDVQQAVPQVVPAQVEAHWPPMQNWPLWQTFVQVPQWVASDATHEPLHSIVPDPQTHTLLWQTCPPRQGMPQPPQLFESALVSMQEPLQAICDPLQLSVPPPPPEPLAPLPAVPGVPPVPLAQAATVKRNARPMPAKQLPLVDRRAVFIDVRIPGRR